MKVLLRRLGMLFLSLSSWHFASGQNMDLLSRLTEIFSDGSNGNQRISVHEDHPLSCLGFTWSQGTMAWDTITRDSMAYFPNGNLALKQEWNYFQHHFQPHSRTVYEYDALNRPKRTVWLSWNGANWDSTDMERRGYDGQRQDTYRVMLHWSGGSWDTVSGQRWTNFYDAGNLLIERHIADYNSSNDSWLDNGRELYHRNAQGEWDTLTYLYPSSGNWLPQSRIVDVVWHDYAQLLFAQFKYQEYGPLGWEDESKGTFSYGPNESYVARFLTYTTAWDSAYMEVVTNDAQHHRTLHESSNWSNGWVLTDGQIDHYTYDAQLRTLEVWNEIWDQGSYGPEEKMVYDNFFVVGLLSAQIRPDLQVWPNPVGEVLHLQLPQNLGAATVSLLDLQGRILQQWSVHSGAFQADLQLDETMPSGTYLYHVSGKTQSYQGRVVLLH